MLDKITDIRKRLKSLELFLRSHLDNTIDSECRDRYNDICHLRDILPEAKLYEYGFQEGDIVECLIYGTGKVLSINPKKEFCVDVQFRTRTFQYTMEGKPVRDGNVTLSKGRWIFELR